MIQIIWGEKGTGKTKRLIDLANDALKSEHGDIVFIDDDKRYMYDLRHEVRFVDTSEYSNGMKRPIMEVLSFLCGMLSANFDISLIAMDAFTSLTDTPLDSDMMRAFFARLEELSENHKCSFLISVNAGNEETPDYIQKYII